MIFLSCYHDQETSPQPKLDWALPVRGTCDTVVSEHITIFVLVHLLSQQLYAIAPIFQRTEGQSKQEMW